MQLQSGLSSILGFMWAQLVNILWPQYLGGTPRWYKMVSGTPNQSSLSAVKKLAEDGTWSPVIDSEWEMEDALKVCSLSLILQYIWSLRLTIFTGV